MTEIKNKQNKKRVRQRKEIINKTKEFKKKNNKSKMIKESITNKTK